MDEAINAVCLHCGTAFEYVRRNPSHKPRMLCSDECKRAKINEAKARYRAANLKKHAATNSAWNKAHRTEANAATDRWRERNRERFLQQQRSYNQRRQTPPEATAEYQRRRRAAKKSSMIGRITPDLLAAKCAYWGNRCWSCGSTDRVELDHVKPLSKGGAHCLANIRPVCRSCNAMKNARWPVSTTRGW
jgi:5-methylcytosine-specific restriction endonuclease McrA